MRGLQTGDPLGRGGEQDPVPGLGGFDPEPDREMGFPGPWCYQRFGAGSGVFVQVSLFLRLMQ